MREPSQIPMGVELKVDDNIADNVYGAVMMT